MSGANNDSLSACLLLSRVYGNTALQDLPYCAAKGNRNTKSGPNSNLSTQGCRGNVLHLSESFLERLGDDNITVPGSCEAHRTAFCPPADPAFNSAQPRDSQIDREYSLRSESDRHRQCGSQVHCHSARHLVPPQERVKRVAAASLRSC